MKEIKRYEMNHKGLPEPDDKGVWVFHEDCATIVAAKDVRISELEDVNKSVTKNYLRVTDERNEALYKVNALQEQVRVLAAENSALARYFSASSVAVNHWNSWADTEDKLACAPETPAADAVVREIRKQAVEGFSEFCGDNSVFIQATCNYDSLADAAYIYLARISAGEQP